MFLSEAKGGPTAVFSRRPRETARRAGRVASSTRGRTRQWSHGHGTTGGAGRVYQMCENSRTGRAWGWDFWMSLREGEGEAACRARPPGCFPRPTANRLAARAAELKPRSADNTSSPTLPPSPAARQTLLAPTSTVLHLALSQPCQTSSQIARRCDRPCFIRNPRPPYLTVDAGSSCTAPRIELTLLLAPNDASEARTMPAVGLGYGEEVCPTLRERVALGTVRLNISTRQCQ